MLTSMLVHTCNGFLNMLKKHRCLVEVGGYSGRVEGVLKL